MLPKNRPPTSPGDILDEEFLKPLHMSQAQLAHKMGVSTQTINLIVNGKRALTAETALGLARVFRNSPQFWLGLQMDLDLWKAMHPTESHAGH